MTDRLRDSPHPWAPWRFVAFPLAIIFLFTALPTVVGVGLSLFQWTGGGEAQFVGLSNYRQALRDPTLGNALLNTLIFALISVPLTIGLAFPLAVAMDAQWLIGRTVVRTIFFLPTVISIVAIGLLWRWLLEPSSAGLLNHVLNTLVDWTHSLGLGPDSLPVQWPEWLGNNRWGLSWIILISTWRGLGFAVVLYLAAIGNVPKSHFDAAAVDGAGPAQTVRHITWPAVWPMTVFLLITGMIGALQVFDIVYVMMFLIEQPHTDVLNLYLYREFVHSRLGYAATIGVVLLVATALITLIEMLWTRRATEAAA